MRKVTALEGFQTLRKIWTPAALPEVGETVAVLSARTLEPMGSGTVKAVDPAAHTYDVEVSE